MKDLSRTGFQFITDKGFCSELPITIKEEVVVEKKPYVLDVPSFMKHAPRPIPAIEPVDNVVYLFSKDGSKEEDYFQEDDKKYVKGLKKVVGKVRKVFVNLPPVKYFIDDHQQTKKGDK